MNRVKLKFSTYFHVLILIPCSSVLYSIPLLFINKVNHILSSLLCIE